MSSAAKQLNFVFCEPVRPGAGQADFWPVRSCAHQ